MNSDKMNIFITSIELHDLVKSNSLAMNLWTENIELRNSECKISHLTDYASSLFLHRNEIYDVKTELNAQLYCHIAIPL